MRIPPTSLARYVGIPVLVAAAAAGSIYGATVARHSVTPHAAVRVTPGPCTASEVRLQAGGRGIVDQNTFAQEITVRNVSGSACQLGGLPKVTDRSGTASVVPGPNVLNTIPGALAPGATARFSVIAPTSCTTPTTSAPMHAADIELPGDAHSSTVRGLEVGTQCGGIEVTPLGLDPTDADDKPDALAGVSLRISVPHVVRVGTAADYTVTIHNPTSASIPLTNCPTFSVGSFSGMQDHAVHTLPCPSAGIAPGASLVVKGEVPIPATARGSVKVFWTLGTPSRPTVGTILVVR
jgi:Protein of unknown function (DUF4232)